MRHLFLVVSICTGCVPSNPATRDGAVLCRSADDCEDGIFCNGREACAPADPESDEHGCVPGEPPCERGCSEAGAGCADCVPADADGDGWAAIACGGPDCDDADPNRFPENVEVCDVHGHDEDCDPTTFGDLDLDGDGEIWSGCCNDVDDASRCGPDCDDTRTAVGSFAAERCNGRDDDCDGESDEGLLVAHYADLDDDGFGDDLDSLMACAPVGRYRRLRGGDCDDGRAMVSPAGVELCNGLDDDCNGVVDDGAAIDVCARDGVGEARCVSGVCAIAACQVGRADCDGDPANGCEADLDSVTTCGSCDVECEPQALGTVACIERVCDVSACAYDAHRCDGRCVRRSLDACGDDCAPCPPVAHGTPRCGFFWDRYQCGATCDPGYGQVLGSSLTTCVWVDPTPLLIEVPGAYLTPAFRGSATDYQIDVDAETTSVRVRVILPLPTDGVEITLNGEPLEQEVLSAPVPVAVGETALYVGTVAESGRSALYTLRVVRPSGGGPP